MQELDFTNPNTYFDFKSFLFRILTYWYLFVISAIIGLSIAYYVSQRAVPIYKMSSLITLKDDQNPLFTNSNTSLTFNWGGQSNKMGSTVTTLKTRTHNERVVKHLQLYLKYLKEGEYQKEDAYGKTPFEIKLKENSFQLQGVLMTIKLIDDKRFEISFDIEEDAKTLKYFNYTSEKTKNETYKVGEYVEIFEIGKPINSKYFNGQLDRIDGGKTESQTFFIQFLDFYDVVKQYQNISVEPQEQGGSVINLGLVGENKYKLVDYLNATTKILSQTQLNQKNMFATNTIKFIDSTLNEKATELEAFENELNTYKLDNNIIDLDTETQQLKDKLIKFDLDKKNLERQIEYLNTLNTYLNNHNTYEDPPAPSIVGIAEGSLVDGVRKIVELSLERSKYQYAAKPDLPTFKDIDRQINATKSVLIENISSSKSNLFKEIEDIEAELREAEREVRKLPQNQQGLLKIERQFNMSQETYNLFLAKRNEAKLIKASNVSDIQIIDEAKDVGGHKIGPNNQLNYVLAAFFGLGLPLVIVFFSVLLDNRINNPKDVEKLTTLPLIGVVGKSNLKSDLAVLEQPRSVITESFRGLRTSLQFVFKNKDITGSKIVLVTSSISGEGKTFNAINLASIMALSGKKTILLGLDLRKPKIHHSFDVDKNIGVSNYLSGQINFEKTIQHTPYENLDIMTSGVIPPNPSELLIDVLMDDLMKKLKSKYDFIILDTPPIGLVSDALNLMKYADATVYIVRQNYTKKGMLKLINQKAENDEVKNVNLVLNYFKDSPQYAYVYNYEYGYGHGYGYGNYGKGYIKKEKTKHSIFQRIKNKMS